MLGGFHRTTDRVQVPLQQKKDAIVSRPELDVPSRCARLHLLGLAPLLGWGFLGGLLLARTRTARGFLAGCHCLVTSLPNPITSCTGQRPGREFPSATFRSVKTRRNPSFSEIPQRRPSRLHERSNLRRRGGSDHRGARKLKFRRSRALRGTSTAPLDLCLSR